MTIRNDATRATVRPKDPRALRSVVARQGQVLLDADLDQQSREALHRVETETQDVLGSPGRLVVPAGSNAFAVTAAATPDACALGAGHGYLDGWLVENTADAVLLSGQPHPRTETTPAPPFLIALKSLVRYVDPVEEPAFADPALGDAQASGRALVDWQAFPFVPAAGWGPGSPGCAVASAHPDWVALAAPSSGTLTVVPDAAPPSDDPCSLTPQGGYSRTENLLYRVEVHGGVPRADLSAADGPRFKMNGLRVKMSRRNASVLARVTAVDGTRITVAPPALDPLNWFAPGAYAEFVTAHDDLDPHDALAGERLFQVARATDTVVTVEAGAAALATRVKTSTQTWFLRLWDAVADGTGAATVKPSAAAAQTSDPVDLGDGLKVVFGTGALDTFRRGDHWTFAARADGTVDWPAGVAEPPHGPAVRYAPLAVVTEPAPTAPEDCRVPAAALTDRVLLYRGGDGQEVPVPAAGGFVALPATLQVAVMRGRAPVPGARVQWVLPTGAVATRVAGAPVDATHGVTTTTGSEGLTEVVWSLDSAQPGARHQVRAELLLPAGGTARGPGVTFTAAFRTAASTSYDAADACTLLAAATTVKDALDVLCANVTTVAPTPTLQLGAIQLRGPGAVTELLKDPVILNGLEVPHTAFLDGILLATQLSGKAIKPESAMRTFDPVVEVELDLPYPTTDADKIYWATVSTKQISRPFGFQRLRLEGSVAIEDAAAPGVLWKPSDAAVVFLKTANLHRWGQQVTSAAPKQAGWGGTDADTVLCRLRVRSAHVWAEDPNTKKRAYLNAEHLGTKAGSTDRELLVKERDPQRAADLEMFFYLKLG